MILNENFQLSGGDLATFRTTPQRRKLDSGTRLYRFVTPNENYLLGKFWLDYQSFANMKSFADSHNCSITQVARSWSAVKYAWNSKMNCLCEIRLRKDCYAWIGAARFQRYDDPKNPEGKNILWMGNATQVFVPNLSNQTVQISSFTYLD